MKFSEFNRNDIKDVNRLFIDTFSDSEGKEEGEIIGRLSTKLMLKTNDTDHYGFIATENDTIVAAVFFTKLSIKSDVNVFMLSPMATLTSFQGKGIGQKLIKFAHNILKDNGVSVVVTYGDINFYGRVGYYHISEAIIKAPFPLSMPDGWLGQSLISNILEAISDKPTCVEAFQNAELW